MNIAENFIFIALNSHVFAIDRDSGEIRWTWKAPKSGTYMTLLPDGDRLIVSAGGYIYCLDPATGQEIWNNPLKGYGTGVAALASLYQRTPDTDIAATAAKINEESESTQITSG